MSSLAIRRATPNDLPQIKSMVDDFVAALVARMCFESAQDGAKFLQGGGGEGSSRLYERVAIGTPEVLCHLSGKAFQTFATLDGLPVRDIVRRLPARHLGLQPAN
jgi:hypothetical protein